MHVLMLLLKRAENLWNGTNGGMLLNRDFFTAGEEKETAAEIEKAPGFERVLKTDEQEEE